MRDTDRVLTVTEAADYLKVSRQHVHNLIIRGNLDSFKVGRCVRIRCTDLAAMIDGSAT